jgi:ATP-binding cassette subfamily F protein 3
VIRAKALGKRYGDKRVLRGVELELEHGAFLVVTGPNGSGKTTLLRIILGETEPLSGEVDLDPALQIGYYEQEHAEFDPAKTVLEEIRSVREGMSTLEARSYIARFLFTGEGVFKTLGQLSGGEQSRVRLAKLILTAPEVLVLDEPTNHLDIPSLEALEEALLDFHGTIIAVSHDRYFLDRIIERLLVLRPEEHGVYAGNYSSYIQQLEQGDAASQSTLPSPRKRPPKKKADRKRPQEAPKRATAKYDHLTVEQIEEMIMERETELALLHEQFGDPAIVTDPEALEDLKDRADEVAQALSELETAWEEREDAI